MDRFARPPRGRVAAAVTVSVLVHALVGFGWWASQGRHASAAAAGITTHVDGPADDGMSIVLRDRPPPRPRALPSAVTEPARPTEPVLPAAAVGPGPKPPDAGAPSQPGTSPDGADSLPKSGGAKPLHGPIRAGQSVVYVLDRSSSMGADGQLPAATAAIKASLATLGPDARFQIVAYNGVATTLSSELLPATPTNVQRAQVWLDQLWADGRSDHLGGIREALWLQPGALFLLTDADDLGEDEARRVAKLIRGPVRLCAVVFGSRRSTAVTPLERLVREHGGAVQYVGRE